MKIYISLLFALTITFLSAAPAKPENPAKQLSESLLKWKKISASNDNYYSYQVLTSSFSGASSTTTITVEKGIITKREYTSTSHEFDAHGMAELPLDPNKNQPEKKTNEYTETGDTVGKDKRGAPAKTLDTLYAEAKQMLDKPLAEHEKLYFKTDPNGILLHCFKIDTRIADDAPIKGVIISNLAITKKEAASKKGKE